MNERAACMAEAVRQTNTSFFRETLAHWPRQFRKSNVGGINSLKMATLEPPSAISAAEKEGLTKDC